MRFLLLIFANLVLLSLTSCIGSYQSQFVDGLPYRSGDARTLDLIRRATIGLTHDQLILRYGPPSHTAKLDNGYKLMQYDRRRRWIIDKDLKINYNCELRLWMKDKKVSEADYLGDGEDCLRFLLNARRNATIDKRIIIR